MTKKTRGKKAAIEPRPSMRRLILEGLAVLGVIIGSLVILGLFTSLILGFAVWAIFVLGTYSIIFLVWSWGMAMEFWI